MGINDRDYIRQPDSAGQVSFLDLVKLFWKMAAILVGLVVCMRVPGPVFLKLALAVLVLFLGIRWMVRGLRKSGPDAVFQKGLAEEKRRNFGSAMALYETAAKRRPKETHILLRLLAAYDAGGEAGKARSLVNHLNGRLFHDSDVHELQELAGKYCVVDFDRAAGGSVLRVEVPGE